MTTSVTLHLRCIASPPAHGGCAHAPTVQYTSPGPVCVYRRPRAWHPDTRVRLLYPPCSSGAAPRPAVPKGGNPRGSAEGSTGPVRLRASSCFTPIRKLGGSGRGRGSTFEVNVSIDVRLTFRLFTRSGKVSLTVGAALDTRQTGPVPGVRTRRPDPGEIKLYPDRGPTTARARSPTFDTKVYMHYAIPFGNF